MTQWAGVGARGGRERIENMGWTCVRNGWLPNVASSMKPVMGDVCAARVRGMWCSGLSHACAFHGRGRRGRGEKRDMELRAMFVDRLCRDLLGRHREAAAVRVCRARGALAARAPSDVYDAHARDMAAGSRGNTRAHRQRAEGSRRTFLSFRTQWKTNSSSVQTTRPHATIRRDHQMSICLP